MILPRCLPVSKKNCEHQNYPLGGLNLTALSHRLMVHKAACSLSTCYYNLQNLTLIKKKSVTEGYTPVHVRLGKPVINGGTFNYSSCHRNSANAMPGHKEKVKPTNHVHCHSEWHLTCHAKKIKKMAFPKSLPPTLQL